MCCVKRAGAAFLYTDQVAILANIQTAKEINAPRKEVSISAGSVASGKSAAN